MTLRRVALLDTETTGLSPENSKCIEVAVTLYDLVLAAPIASFASLIRSETNEAFAVNRIPVEALKEAPDADTVWRRVLAIVGTADVFMAHRAEFDRGFTPEPLRSSRPWSCSKFAVEWPEGKGGDHLLHLALAHGVGVVHAHRAMSDVDTLSRLLTRVAERGVDLVRLVERSLRPRTKIRAMVSYDDREKARSAGFAWESSTKVWWKEVFVEDAGTFPFPTQSM